MLSEASVLGRRGQKWTRTQVNDINPHHAQCREEKLWVGRVARKKHLSGEMVFSWCLNDEMELAPERCREKHSKQKEQKAERPQDKFSNCEEKEEGWGGLNEGTGHANTRGGTFQSEEMVHAQTIGKGKPVELLEGT